MIRKVWKIWSDKLKEAQSSKDAQKDEYYGLYSKLCKMIEMNDWQGAEDFVKRKKEA